MLNVTYPAWRLFMLLFFMQWSEWVMNVVIMGSDVFEKITKKTQQNIMKSALYV